MQEKEGKISFIHIVALFVLYINVSIFFAMIYLVLEMLNLGFIVDHYTTIHDEAHSLESILRTLYFSCITLMSVGYGDVTPFGWSRGISIIEALIGFILPATFVLKYLNLFKK